ncbi:5-deoxy-glucuronate isomerase [Ahrensia marina]|uniref:5-deoxy-glucuronate isomerase n=1 Tax=Ahrensia marina TaxID=1514904 RepID=UPI0035D004BC
MARLIPASDTKNAPIVGAGDETLSLITFRLVELTAGETLTLVEPDHEVCLVPFSGTVHVEVDGQRFDDLGGRDDVFSGLADSVYVPANRRISLVAFSNCEIGVAGAKTEEDADATPFRVTPDEVEEVEVGSRETHSRRRIRHILGQRQNGRVQRLLVSELYADPGCWSGYPPHKHDTDDGVKETNHEELYHYRFNPETGFGGQSCYNEGEAPTTFTTRHGDTFCLDRGYHPTVTSPGHEGYIFTVLAGYTQRGLVQRFESRHAHLMAAIPGIQGMRDAFK